MKVAARTRRWWPRSLRRQLMLGVCAVVSVVLLTVGTVSVLILRGQMMSTVDSEVSRTLAALSASMSKFRHSDSGIGHGVGSAADDGLAEFIGHAEGNVIAVLRNGAVAHVVVFAGGEPLPASPDVVRAIETQSWAGGSPRTVKLDGLGSYRMQGREVDGGDVLVSGMSLESANQAITRKTVTTIALIIAALFVTAGGTILVVRYALRPLRRVAATAAEVATLPLDQDGFRITARVPDSDTHPDSEVGVVGDTLNRLLVNVDSALAERAASDTRMKRFITDASHELRTPLAAIQGYAELTRQDSSKLPPTTEYALARVEAEAHRMTSLVDQLLTLSRLDEGHDLQAEEVDLVDITIHAVNDATVSGRSHHWVTNLPDTPLWVRGDRARLHQLISNLLTNARVHTPAGAKVTTGVNTVVNFEGAAYAELTVEDDGPDIDPELLPRLFERFVRADKARSRSPELAGAGLGLAIVASIVEAHGGSVTAESAHGRTVFRVRIPLIRTPDSVRTLAPLQ